MKRIPGILTLLSILPFAGVLFAECDLHRHEPGVEGAWIREAPPVVKVMAGYLTIHNPTEEEMVLEGAESPLFDRIEIHRTEMKGGMAGMERQQGVTIPARGRVEFAPGGLHLMLMGPKKPLAAGSTATITLHFKGGQTLPVQFTVRAGGDGSSQHGHHH
ncbi:MAG TPA: copper chaperone PCu(A)C [Gammaproteobacteria bacterium]|nr:copper chaperone PCu(A)C [Gammaproteobacteria bacterium]